MKTLLEKIFNNPNKFLILSLIAIILFFAAFQIGIPKVTANVVPIWVNEVDLAFGIVFPGEDLEGNFIVNFIEGQGQDGVNYKIIQKRKLLLEEHPEYPDGGDPEMPGYYRNLCPFLTKVSVEKEGDTEDLAFVGESDLSDSWVIYFKVPAIVGHVSQDHIGGVVTSNGEYGCDVSIDILE